ncbi:MAG: NlpC/P60 family protein [Anaerovoracaceae bacterium]
MLSLFINLRKIFIILTALLIFSCTGLAMAETEPEPPAEETLTVVSGLNVSPSQKSRKVLTDAISITPGKNRTIQLQYKDKGKWIKKKEFTTADTEVAALNLIYSNDWWKLTETQWRIVVFETETEKEYTSATINLTTTRYYQNPKKYIKIKDNIILKHKGNYSLKLGYMGLKVRKVNNYFHIGNKNWPRYTYLTKSKVKTFQKKKGLKVTGVVNEKTWLKMGFSEESWNNLGAYVSPIKVNPSSTKKQHVEAMIKRAKEYKGKNYVVGASGRLKDGVDCSGLVMQALFAAGVDPYPVSPVRHSKPAYEYESRRLWKDKRYKTVPYSKKKRGDLIFYHGGNGVVIHVAIYLGKGKVIESWPNKVVIWPVKNGQRSLIKGVKRVFN